MAKKTKEWKNKVVGGKVQRAATYQPGWDVVCVRAPSAVIDKIRALAKKGETSISQLVSAKFGFHFSAGKRGPKPKIKVKAKRAKPAKKAAPNHAPAQPTPETSAEATA